MADTLFDLTDYGGTEPTAHEKRRNRKTTTTSSPVEPHQEPWTCVRQIKGMLPFFHVIASQNSQGSVLTYCGQWGTKVTNLGVDDMIRCPMCQIELER